MTKKVNIHWFRNDLRLDDNPSLTKATENSELIPIYIFDENATIDFNQGEASLTWLYESLKLLNKSLENGLVIFKGDPLKILKELIKNNNVSGVYWNRNYAPWEIKRDTIIKQEIKKACIECETFNANLLWEPWEIIKKDGTPYKVFTPFYSCLLYTSPSPRDPKTSRMPSSA